MIIHGNCSLVTSAEAIAYLYADKPKEFELKYGFPLYDENNHLNDEIYFEYYMLNNALELHGYSRLRNDDDEETKKEKMLENINIFLEGIMGKSSFPNKRFMVQEEGGLYTFPATWYTEPTTPEVAHFPNDFVKKYDKSNEITFNVDYSEVQDKYDYYEDYYREYGHRGNISLVKNAIDDSNKAVVIGIYPEEEKYVTMTDMNGNEAHLDGGHMANVIYVDGNDIYIDTWGGIYKIDLEDLRENTWTFNFTSYELVEK